METAFTLSSSSSSLPSLKIPRNSYPRVRFNLFNLSSSCSSRTLDSISINAVSASPSSRSSPSKSSSWISTPPGLLVSNDRRSNDFSVRSSNFSDRWFLLIDPKDPDNDESFRILERWLILVFTYAAWFVCCISSTTFTAKVLAIYPYPVTLSAIQLGIATVYILWRWAIGMTVGMPRISTWQLAKIFPLVVAHTLSNIFINLSFTKVPASFTHTVRTTESLFGVIIDAIFLGKMPTQRVVSSVAVVVGGVALASVTQASFNWIGFWSAMASALTTQYLNVFGRMLMIKKTLGYIPLEIQDESYVLRVEQEPMDNFALYSIITIMSFILTIPVAVFMEGAKLTSYLQSSGFNFRTMYTPLYLSAVTLCIYQRISFKRLQSGYACFHSISSVVRRVGVIWELVSEAPVSPINALGTVVALAGEFMYSIVREIEPQWKKL